MATKSWTTSPVAWKEMNIARRFIKRAKITDTDYFQTAGAIVDTDTETMGRVLTAAMIENLEDIWAAKRGLVDADQIRRIEVTDALVDSGATLLSIPSRLIQKLGLERVTTKKVSSSTGPGEANIYSAVRLTIQGRSCTMDVLEVPDGVPILIGQLPLEHLDFVVDMRSHSLIGNPAHGGEHIYELM